MTIDETLELQTKDGVVSARLKGEIDLSNAAAIGSLIAGAVTNDASGVVLDLTETTYLDSSGVHLVFDLHDRLRARQQRLVLVIPAGARIRRVLELVNVESVIPVVSDIAEGTRLTREPPKSE